MLVIGGLFAEIIRAQLASPNGSLVSLAQYNELFTMHGSVMIYLFAGPFAFGGLANIIVPHPDRRARHGVPATERALATGST